jgi:mRNA interferase MazF
MVKNYIPKKGDLVILTFNPSAGHEQQGRRPALIVSNEIFNKHLGLAIACPITNTDRDFPFHIKLDSDKLTGFVMCEQLKSIDYKVRKVKFVQKASEELMSKVLGIVESMIFQK